MLKLTHHLAPDTSKVTLDLGGWIISWIHEAMREDTGFASANWVEAGGADAAFNIIFDNHQGIDKTHLRRLYVRMLKHLMQGDPIKNHRWLTSYRRGPRLTEPELALALEYFNLMPKDQPVWSLGTVLKYPEDAIKAAMKARWEEIQREQLAKTIVDTIITEEVGKGIVKVFLEPQRNGGSIHSRYRVSAWPTF